MWRLMAGKGRDINSAGVRLLASYSPGLGDDCGYGFEEVTFWIAGSLKGTGNR